MTSDHQASDQTTYALATGHSCVFKGSESCARIFWAIGSVFKQVIGHHPEDVATVTTFIVEKINYAGRLPPAVL